jgi:tRNA dimethylallyltransferase
LDVVRLPIICGPTAAGKSALAMAVAEACGLGIVSADSRQVYRGFDIGTAKPSLDERSRVPHAGIDVADPTERYSAATWMLSVDAWSRALADRGCAPLVVGGTGLYLRTLTNPLFDEPALDPEARRALDLELQSLPLDALRQRCLALDPARAHLGRTQLLRAIEVATLTGTPISALHRAHAREARHDVRFLLVDPGPERLRERIAQRVDAMLAAGVGRRGATPDAGSAARCPRMERHRGTTRYVRWWRGPSRSRGHASRLSSLLDSTPNGSGPGSGTSCRRRMSFT